MQRMRNTWIVVDQTIYQPGQETTPKGRKPRKKIQLTLTSPLFIFGSKILKKELWPEEAFHTDEQTDTQKHALQGPETEIAWAIKEADWMLPFVAGANCYTATLLKSCLEYDPYHQAWESRLSKYFMFHLRMNRHHGTPLKRTIGALINELSLEVDTRHPERTRTHLERALAQLQTDGHIGEWRYENPVQPKARRWLPDWLAQSIQVVAPGKALQIKPQVPE
jgi:hypothetical protein